MEKREVASAMGMIEDSKKLAPLLTILRLPECPPPEQIKICD
jgi:hypothetical protein